MANFAKEQKLENRTFLRMDRFVVIRSNNNNDLLEIINPIKLNVELEINHEIAIFIKNVNGKFGFSLYPKTYTLENFLELCLKPSERRENSGSQKA